MFASDTTTRAQCERLERLVYALHHTSDLAK